MIKKKTAEEIILYRKTGKIAAEILTTLKDHVKVGADTYTIAKYAEELIIKQYDAIPSSIGMYDFKFALNSSPNDVICHGVPSKSDVLKEGDIVNLDLTVKKHGFVADTSRMYKVGKVSEEASRLCVVTHQCLWKGIEQVRPGNTVGDIGNAIETHALANLFTVVREYCGHGIGEKMHEDPQIPHYGKPGKGTVLRKGMTFTIEPMINQGSREMKYLADHWTVVTKDGKLSAQWEHTILVTDSGYEVLTLREEEARELASWF
jgi:methionyl aminopeptidase